MQKTEIPLAVFYSPKEDIVILGETFDGCVWNLRYSEAGRFLGLNPTCLGFEFICWLDDQEEL